VTAVAIQYDVKAQQKLGIDRSRIDTSNNLSLFGSSYATLAESGALYLVDSDIMPTLWKRGVWEQKLSSTPPSLQRG
jgi:hypothetical protein